MEFSTDQNVVQTLGGQQTKIVANIAMGMTLSVVETADEETGVKITYDWSKFKQQHPKFTIDFDSRQPNSEIHPMARGFAEIVGESFVLVLDKAGQPIAVRGVDELLASMVAKLKLENEPEEKAAKVKHALEQHFNEKSLLTTFRQTFGFYPAKPLSIGDSWERTFDMAQGAGMSIANKWTLVGASDSAADIDVSSKISSESSANSDAPMSQELSGTQTGKMKIDLSTGMPVEASLNQALSGTISIKASESIPKDMTVPITMDSKVTISVSKENATS